MSRPVSRAPSPLLDLRGQRLQRRLHRLGVPMRTTRAISSRAALRWSLHLRQHGVAARAHSSATTICWSFSPTSVRSATRSRDPIGALAHLGHHRLDALHARARAARLRDQGLELTLHLVVFRAHAGDRQGDVRDRLLAALVEAQREVAPRVLQGQGRSGHGARHVVAQRRSQLAHVARPRRRLGDRFLDPRHPRVQGCCTDRARGVRGASALFSRRSRRRVSSDAICSLTVVWRISA